MEMSKCILAIAIVACIGCVESKSFAIQDLRTSSTTATESSRHADNPLANVLLNLQNYTLNGTTDSTPNLRVKRQYGYGYGYGRGPYYPYPYPIPIFLGGGGFGFGGLGIGGFGFGRGFAGRGFGGRGFGGRGFGGRGIGGRGGFGGRGGGRG